MKFFVCRGRNVDEVKVLQHVANMNGRMSSLTLEKLEALDNEWDSLYSESEKDM